MHVTMILFPRLTQLDLTAPFEVFARMPETTVELVAASREPVLAERGLAIVPHATWSDAKPADVLFVPGGTGVNEAMLDDALIAFVRRQAEGAQWITSVCTGALILGAAGLLRGYEATTHWAAMQYLERFGATPVERRVVRDRNRVTGGGVTAGLDFAFTFAAELHGEAVAKAIQLGLEYDPHPPFDCGSPRTADEATIAAVRRRLEAMQITRDDAVEAAARRAT
jgi:cyclohexyl-isocyanide hydratase